jgi:hypothetical protein
MEIAAVSVKEFQHALTVAFTAPPVGGELSFGEYTIVEDSLVRSCIALIKRFGEAHAMIFQARIFALVSLTDVAGIAGIHIKDGPDGTVLVSPSLLEVMASIPIHPKTRKVDPAAVLAALALARPV